MSIIGTFPTTIANGQIEDATVVMSLFAWIQSQTNGNACPATTGSAVLKGDGAGGTTIAIDGTNYVSPTTINNASLPASFTQVAVTGNVASSIGYSVINSNAAGYGQIALGSNAQTKTLRCNPTGSLELLNTANNAVVASVNDTGALVTSGSTQSTHFTSTDSSGTQFGGTASIGFFADGSNVAIRTFTGGIIYFQGPSGAGFTNSVDAAGFHGAFLGSGAGLTGTANSLSAGLGVNQTWQNVIGSRSSGTPVTNSSGKTIQVYVRGNHSSLGIPSIQATVGGVEVGYLQLGQSAAGVSGDLSLCFPVPNGASYTVTVSTGVAVWSELF